MTAAPGRRGEVALLGAVALVVLALAARDGVSSVAGELRRGETIALEARGPAGRTLYLVLHPGARAAYALDALPASFPAPLELSARRGLPFRDAAELKAWMNARRPGLRRAWAAIRAAIELRGPRSYERALFAWELYRLPPLRLRWVAPASPVLASKLVELLAREPGPAGGPIRVEVRNASGEPGLAARATRELRARGLDVLDFGNAPPQDSTRSVDRSGRPGDAAEAARVLGCPEPDVAVELDINAAAPVTLILGRDFRECGAFSYSVFEAILPAFWERTLNGTR